MLTVVRAVCSKFPHLVCPVAACFPSIRSQDKHTSHPIRLSVCPSIHPFVPSLSGCPLISFEASSFDLTFVVSISRLIVSFFLQGIHPHPHIHIHFVAVVTTNYHWYYHPPNLPNPYYLMIRLIASSQTSSVLFLMFLPFVVILLF